MNINPKYSFGSRFMQKGLNLFAFLLAFPGIEVFGNSLYFYVFLWILYRTHKRTGKAVLKSRFGFLLLLSWVFGLVSTILHPPLIPETNSISGMILMVIRYAYWFAIAAYFYSWLTLINLKALAKWISIGYIVQVIGFYVLSFKLDAIGFSFNSALTRNAFVFNSILFSGMLFYYFYNRYGKRSFWPVSLFFLINLLLTNGRAGAVIAIFIALLNYSLLKPSMRQLVKYGVVLLIGLSILSKDLEKTAYSYGSFIAPYFETYSPRFANLLRGVDEGDLSFDKSWLLRELMVDKTLEIIADYPLLGVGYGNFSSYSANLRTLGESKYDRLGDHSNVFYNTRSAHNSYANYLGETGIVGFFLFLLIIIPIIIWFVRNYWNGSYVKYGYGIVIVVGLLGGLIHGYAIAAFTGANLWFMLGLSLSLIKTRR